MKLEEFKKTIENINTNFTGDLKGNENIDSIELFYREVINGLSNIIKNEDAYREKNVLEQVIEKNINYINKLNSKNNFEDEDRKIYNEILENFSEEINRLEYLRIFNETNTIVIGANGSGKSSLASYFKESDAEGIIVIPAQKILFFLKKLEVGFASESKIREIQKKNLNDKNYKEDYILFNKVTLLSEVFSYHISAVVNDLANVGAAKIVDNINSEAIYTKLVEIWNKFYYEIELKYDMSLRKLIPKKNGEMYDINSLSEGEKVTLYYIMVTLFAPKDSYIIVDEPETFLNPSIYNRLWYLLEEYRSDCRFIYIYHNIEFISSRNSHSIYWCKSYNGKNDWDIERISGKLDEIPKELVIELLGARKNILFCEGSKESLDYKVYTLLFENQVVVIPVGGHKDVINNTKAYNNSKLFDGEAYGIIDRDYHSEEILNYYKRDKIYHLEFNEIEMFLLIEEILESVLKGNYLPDKSSEKIQNFKDKVIEEVKKRKNYIVNKSIKFYIDEKNFTIDTKKENIIFTEKKIKEYFSELLDEVNIDEKIDELNDRIDKIVNEKNYEEILKLSDFKYLFKNLTKQVFELDYEQVCLTKLQLDKNLREVLRSKYLMELSNELKIGE